LKKHALNIIWLIKVLPKIYKKYKDKTDSNRIYILLYFIYYKLFFNKHITAHKNVKINGLKNLELKGSLEIGVNYFGILLPNDSTFLNIRGKLRINSSHYSIGRGCRFDINKNAIVEIGEGGHITAFTNFIISNKLVIGDDCTISWNCQFLDSDFQYITYKGRKEKENEIIIGNHVWIGSGTQIYKGTKIPDGCVVAANSIVRGEFTKENALIGGNPAKIIKENVKWVTHENQEFISY
jgi:acetyltransferase-like isoleucine patch superfamily enzyme